MPAERERRLYVITPDVQDTARLTAMVEHAFAGAAAGGAGLLLQYRNKTADAALRLEQALALKELCQSYAAPLIINDHLGLALELHADGLHLGAEDGDLQAARARLGPEKWLGASCYDRLDLAEAAVERGADYIAFGAVFASSTKPAAAQASLDLIRRARRRFSRPICAIGGTTPDNAATVLKAGADWLAVIGGLFGAADIRSAAFAFARALGDAGRRG